MIRPAAVSHVANFNLNVFTNARSPSVYVSGGLLLVFAILLVVIFSQQTINFGQRSTKSVKAISYGLDLFLRVSLSFLYYDFTVDIKIHVTNVLNLVFFRLAIQVLFRRLYLRLLKLFLLLLKLFLLIFCQFSSVSTLRRTLCSFAFISLNLGILRF